jgi:HprK-related kinase A
VRNAPFYGDVPTRSIGKALGDSGIWIDVGLLTLHVRSDVELLAAQIQAAYRHFPIETDQRWADLHMELVRPVGLRRWVRPQVVFRTDTTSPFLPFPADTALPLFEWGANWLIGRCMNHVLLLHSGVVERDGLALVLPATPGSGKSTLTAALSLRGWRLLSDEFGAFDLTARRFLPVLKPVALKNASIEVIRRFEPAAPVGMEFPKTRKGTVAHLAASAEAVARVHERADPGAVVLVKWQEGAETRWVPLSEEAAFSALAFNAFNYGVTGAQGFHAVVDLVRRCPAWELVYSDLDDALETLSAAWPIVVDRARRHALETAKSDQDSMVR